jgi:hypothetical protein
LEFRVYAALDGKNRLKAELQTGFCRFFNSLLEASARRYVAIFVSGRAIEIRTLLLALGLLLLLAPNVFGTEREE